MRALLFIFVFLPTVRASAQTPIDTTNVIIIQLAAWTLTDRFESEIGNAFEIRTLPPDGNCQSLSVIVRGNLRQAHIRCGVDFCLYGTRSYLYGWPVNKYMKAESCFDYTRLLMMIIETYLTPEGETVEFDGPRET